jgi:glyoxylase-like metal-dependent hydrolase (beta-lactamase superfamily II)
MARWAPFDDGGERWFGFDGVRALVDRDASILLVPLPGHTVGHTGVAVRAGERWLLHAGDSYFFHGQMLPAPRTPLALRYFQRRGDTDRPARIANQERVRRLALDHSGEVSVFCAHDPVEFDRLAA